MNSYAIAFIALIACIALVAVLSRVYKAYKNDNKISTVELLEIIFKLREELANLLEKVMNLKKFQKVSDEDLNSYINLEISDMIKNNTLLTEKEKSILLATNYKQIVEFIVDKIKE